MRNCQHETFMRVSAPFSRLQLQGGRVGVWSTCFVACATSGKASDPNQVDEHFLFCFLSPSCILDFVCLLFLSRG